MPLKEMQKWWLGY